MKNYNLFAVKKRENPPVIHGNVKKYQELYRKYISRHNVCEQFLHLIDLQLHSVELYQSWHVRAVFELVRLACLFLLPLSPSFVGTCAGEHV